MFNNTGRTKPDKRYSPVEEAPERHSRGPGVRRVSIEGGSRSMGAAHFWRPEAPRALRVAHLSARRRSAMVCIRENIRGEGGGQWRSTGGWEKFKF